MAQLFSNVSNLNWQQAVMGHKKGDRVTVHVNETYSYDIVIRDVQKGTDDDSLPISSY